MPEVTITAPYVLDTYIDSVDYTTNYATNSYLRVGYYDTATNPIDRTLLKFDMSSIPVGAYIKSAQLKLYLFSENSDNNRTMRVYRVKRNWVEDEATWRVYKTGSNWNGYGCNNSDDRETSDIGSINFSSSESTGEWKTINLTASAVQEILDGGVFPNYGFLLKMDTEFRDRYTFYSSEKGDYEPQLIINYTLARQMQSVVIF